MEQGDGVGGEELAGSAGTAEAMLEVLGGVRGAVISDNYSYRPGDNYFYRRPPGLRPPFVDNFPQEVDQGRIALGCVGGWSATGRSGS